MTVSFLFLRIFAAIAVPLFPVACSAQPQGSVQDAQQFLLDAPAFQVISTSVNTQTHEESHGETQVVRGGALHSGGSKFGLMTDGKREFISDGQGPYTEVHGDAAAAYKEQLEKSTLAWLLSHMENNSPLIGHETLGGTPTTIYALIPRKDSLMRGEIKVWIADSDHRPLKVEEKQYPYRDQGPNPTILRTTTTTYHYDSNVKVLLPGP